MRKLIDLTGQRFGKLTVITRAENHIMPSGKCCIMWLCKCDCGNVKSINGSSLRNGVTRSCGCLSKEFAEKLNKKHGKSRSKLYSVWGHMKQRCYNPNNPAYRIYGAENKIICEDWQTFEGFEKWAIEHGYKENLQIERIDNTKGYFPENCKWATRKEQSNNRRTSRMITYRGRTQTLQMWVDELHLNYAMVYNRIFVLNWSVDKAFATVHKSLTEGDKNEKIEA